jgi:O-antigen ligase
MNLRLSWLPFALLLIILPYPGTVAARLLLLLTCFAIATWHWLRRPAMRIGIPCKPALGLWLAVCLASLAYSHDVNYSVGELKNELGYTMMVFFAFLVLGQGRANAVFALRALALGMALMAGWTMLTWVEHGFQWYDGRHGGAGVVATYVVTALPAFFWLSIEDPLPAWQRTARLLVVIALFVAFITTQRAAWPALAVEAAIAVAFLAHSGRIALGRQQFVLTLVALLAVLLGTMLLVTLLRYNDAQAMVSDSRLRFWPSIIETIANHPLYGAGFGRQSMKIAYPQLIPGYNPELWHAHNVFLNYGLSLGVPGMFALAALFAAWGMFFWRAAVGGGSAVVAGIAGLAMIAGVMMRNQFNDFFMRDMSLLFWSLTGLYAGRCVATAATND